MSDLPKVCELCGSPTPAAELVDEWYPYAQVVSEAARCFRCYRLETLIKENPELAHKILDAMKCEEVS